ncbi:hypothetical protein [Pseudalkalibacillus berkeleyi]|uniref:Lipoprotein n=1 Tax=Pseudalkalibacillus berkeleyi TaxID=1069813 RepID=A0ABS9H1K6_9BACL|nr:hypothetical protein [Pseudalkalibacillus berkeleyi]MCF6138867.1 hypothetical protein [Pseudalkalibacillus berkeleyi]
MKKSFLAKLGSALLAIMLITACNGTEDEPANEEPSSEEQETNTDDSGTSKEDSETSTEDGESSEEGS